MDLDRIFTADQIAVPPDLPQIIKDYTKAVIRACPEDLLTFSLAYFQKEVARTSERPDVIEGEGADGGAKKTEAEE